MNRSGAVRIGNTLSSLLLGAAGLFVFFVPTIAFAQLSMTLEASENEVRPGEDFVYSIRVTNGGGSAFSGETLKLVLDSNLQFRTATRGGGGGDIVEWRDQTFAAGSTETYTATVRVNSNVNLSTVDDVKSTASVRDAFKSTRVSLDAEDTREQDHDFDLSISADQTRVEIGDTVTYTIKVKNNKDRIARNASVRLSLDKELTFRFASTNGRESGNKTVLWDNLSLNPNETITLTATAEVQDDVEEDETLLITAQGGNDTTSIRTEVENPDVDNIDDNRDIALRLSASEDQLKPDDIFTYTVRVQNKDDRRVNNLEVTLDLNDKFEFLSASNGGSESGQKVVWNNIEVNGNAKRELTVSLRVKDDVRDQDRLESTVFTEGVVAEDSIRIFDNRGFELIAIHAFTDNVDVEAGGDITYTIRLRNEGDEDETIDMEALLDPRMKFGSATEGGELLEQHLVEWEDIFIEQNETKDITLTVEADEDKVKLGDSIRVIINAGQDTRHLLSRIVGEGEPTQFSQRPGFGPPPGFAPPPVAQRPPPAPAQAVRPAQTGLAIQKVADKPEAQPGSIVTYAITVHNPTNATFSDLRVIDALSREHIAILNVGGGAQSAEGIEWSIQTLDPGQTWETRYQVRILRALTHGTVVRSAVRIEGENVVAGAHSAAAEQQTNVIRRLPQAGYGSYVFAAAMSDTLVKKVQAKKIVKAAAPAKKKVATQKPLEVPGWMWIVVGLVGVSLGGAFALKKS